MPNLPSDSVPGPIIRFPGLVTSNNTLVDPTVDASADALVVVRSFVEADEVTESPENGKSEEATEPDIESIEKREVPDSMVLSRKGVYRVLESRLDA